MSSPGLLVPEGQPHRVVLRLREALRRRAPRCKELLWLGEPGRLGQAPHDGCLEHLRLPSGHPAIPADSQSDSCSSAMSRARSKDRVSEAPLSLWFAWPRNEHGERAVSVSVPRADKASDGPSGNGWHRDRSRKTSQTRRKPAPWPCAWSPPLEMAAGLIVIGAESREPSPLESWLGKARTRRVQESENYMAPDIVRASHRPRCDRCAFGSGAGRARSVPADGAGVYLPAPAPGRRSHTMR